MSMRALFLKTFLPVLGLCTACGGGGGGGGSGPAQIQGTILFTPVGAPLSESEPNDGLDGATPAGMLAGAVRVELAGELGGADRIDSFALLAREGLDLRVTLRAEGALAGEAELAVFDAVEQRFVASSRSALGAEVCEFAARGSFDLVVRGAGAAGAYRIELVAKPAERAARGFTAHAGYEPREDTAFALYREPVLESRAGEIIVLASDGVDLSVELARHGLLRKQRIPGAEELVGFDLDSALDRSASARATVARVRGLAEEPSVERCELNLVRHAQGGAQVTPNDPHYVLQWHYPLIHLPEAWATTTGDDAVIVAVIDTGETQHPDLVGRQIQGFDMIADASVAADGNGYDSDPTDVGDGEGLQPSSFHGTHVAGTIGASTNNALGVSGVTWAGKIMHLRVLGKGGGSDFDIASAIRYAARLSNASNQLPALRAHVINLSLGGPGSTSTVQSAVTAARNAGTVIFAASGNSNSNVAFYPAAANGVVSISAVDINSNKAPYSNFHPTVDFCAPGGDVTHDLNADGYADGVLSTLLDDSSQPASFIYGFYNGTSMACPHAAGVASLMLAADPGHDLTPAQIDAMLEASSHDLGAPGHDSIYGHGLIDAAQAVLLASGTGPTGPVLSVTPATLAFGSSQTMLAIQVTNLGTGTIDVTSVDASSTPPGWLAAAEGPAGSGSDVGSVTVTVDRSGLVPGTYQGSVTITSSNAGTKEVPVTLQVATVQPPVDVDLFVLAVELDTGEFGTLAQAVVNPTTTLDYVLGDLPSGSYLVVCGSDDDDDGFICGEGDVYCGFYPTPGDPLAIDVDAGDTVTDADFPVTPSTTTGAAGGHGFRLLAPR